jgi:hypothetical protein
MFAIYCQIGKTCDFLRRVTIAGVICQSITSKPASIKPKKNDTMPCELSGAELCRAVIAKHGMEAEATLLQSGC